MDESYLSWLAMIPGIGRRKAEAIADRFPNLEALRGAAPNELETIEGVGPVLARRVKEFAEKSDARPDFWYRKDASLYLCPSCGRLLAEGTDRCPSCGTELEGEEPEEEAPELIALEPAVTPEERIKQMERILSIASATVAQVEETASQKGPSP